MPTSLRLASIVAQGRPGTAKRGLWRKGAAIASDSGLWEKGIMPLLPLLGLLLSAAQPAPQSDAAITVEASRITPEQARVASTAYARAGLPPNPNYGQYARWQGPICASVRGIPDPAVAGLVLARIKAAVAETGLSVWDRAFLKGLYAMQMNRSAQRQRQQLISAIMARELVADVPPQ